MAAVPYVLAYAAIVVFVVAVIARFFMWSKMPLHLRWELYPVAHEGKRARYGGSYLEETDWWTRPREVSKLSEAKAMFAEIVFLVAVKENNPKLWTRSFPFHFGLYLVAACTVVMMASGVLASFAPTVLAGTLGSLVQNVIVALGVAGLCLGILGALGLIQRRLADPGLRDFSTGADFFNLIFFVVTFGVALLTFVLVDHDFARVTGLVHGLVGFELAPLSGGGLAAALPVASLVLMSLLVAYIPLTHMSHFVGKYFAYHAIRWNDAPNLRGSDEEATIGGLLSRPVTWSASHIGADGKKTWADVATEEMEK
jgi:nitrate reductase gamma subunit